MASLTPNSDPKFFKFSYLKINELCYTKANKNNLRYNILWIQYLAAYPLVYLASLPLHQILLADLSQTLLSPLPDQIQKNLYIFLQSPFFEAILQIPNPLQENIYHLLPWPRLRKAIPNNLYPQKWIWMH